MGGKPRIKTKQATIRVLLPDYRNPPEMKAYITDEAYQELNKELAKASAEEERCICLDCGKPRLVKLENFVCRGCLSLRGTKE